MAFGLTILTFVHIWLSLIAIAAGVVVLFGMLTSRPFKRLTVVFLWTTVATSATGFLFPFHQFLPSHGVGILSLVLLAVAFYALYRRRLAGAWRRTYAITAVLSLYLNVFVLIVQLFQKVPALRALAPTQTEGPFKATQLVVLCAFVVLTILAAVRFRGDPLAQSSPAARIE